MITRLIGERFEYGGKVFYAALVTSNKCLDCCFYLDDTCPHFKPNSIFGPCAKEQRSEHKDIVWRSSPLIQIY